jgi:phosphopantetheinyl transferase
LLEAQTCASFPFFPCSSKLPGINVTGSFNIGLSLLSSNAPGTIRREQLSAEGRRILSLLAGRPLAETDIQREENGRPYFANGEENFNLSHSGALTAVSLVTGKNVRTGCDVQRIQARAHTMNIAKEFFSDAERMYIAQDKTRFFEIWTLKECFLKLRGLSVLDMAKVPSFIVCAEDSGHTRFVFDAATPSPLSFFLYKLTGSPHERYILAAAIEGTGQLRPAIQWFSQNSLSCRSIAEINLRR